MALQSKINEIYPNRKPFMDIEGKRKAVGGKDLRVQTLLAQEAAKRHCTGLMNGLPQEQQAPILQQQNPNSTDGRGPTDFAGFFHQLQQEKQQTQHQHRQQDQQQFDTLDQHQHYQQERDSNHHHQQQQHLQQADDIVQHNQQPQTNHLAAEQQHQQQEQLHQSRQQQHQQGGCFSLDELLTQHSLASRDCLPERELRHLVSLDRAFGADTSRDGFMRGGLEHRAAGGANSSSTAAAAAAAAAAGARQQWHLTQLPYVPWDWSIKSRVRLSSAVPFAVLEEARTAGLESLCYAMSAGGACGGRRAELSSQERLAQVLMQWQHPSAPMPTALLPAQAGTAAAAAAAMAAGTAAERRSADAAAGLLPERVQAWREALRSAYTALRHGHCPVLYIHGQAFRQPFTAVLCAPGVLAAGSNRMLAVVSRSNRQLRAHLAAYGAEGQLAGLLEQAVVGQQQQQQQPSLPAGAFDGQPGSQLMLFGAMQVHGLYAALLALPWCKHEQPDVPLLYAPVPFMHAQLCMLKLEVLPDVVLEQQEQQVQQRGAAAATAAAAPLQPLHYAELKGPGCLMPWTVHRLLVLMQDTQVHDGFQAFLDTDPSSSSLNVPSELWPAAEAAAVEAGGQHCSSAAAAAAAVRTQHQAKLFWQQEVRGLTPEEAREWGTSAALLQGRVLRQLKGDGDGLAARLA